MMDPNPAPPRLTRFEDLAFVPRFEHGDMAQLARSAVPMTVRRWASALPAWAMRAWTGQ